MIRLLLDQGLAPAAASNLRSEGFDAVHVSELGLSAASDSELLDCARAGDRVCVTLDHDFHAHLAATGQTKISVVLLRVQSLDSSQQAELIRNVVTRCETALTEGAAVSADSDRIRIRRLPLRPA